MVIPVIYQWKSAVKFGGITSGILVVYQWYISAIPVEMSGKIWWYYQWYIGGIPPVYQWNFGGVTSGIPVEISGKTLLSTDITVEISGFTTVLPLESTVLPVVIPPNFTADFQWYTKG